LYGRLVCYPLPLLARVGRNERACLTLTLSVVGMVRVRMLPRVNTQGHGSVLSVKAATP